MAHIDPWARRICHDQAKLIYKLMQDKNEIRDPLQDATRMQLCNAEDIVSSSFTVFPLLLVT
jgi:hypothetical protein